MPLRLAPAALALALCALAAAPLHAQWSVRADDPRPRQPAYLYEVFSVEDWEKSNFATARELQWFRDAKYGMFVHFGLSTYKNAELSWGVCEVRKGPDKGSGPYPASEWTTWAREFRIPDFDARRLVRHAQVAGMKYLVVVAKHHDGFHMWDTALSDFKVTNTPFGRDFLKEIADACQAAGLKFGIYYSQRDWVHPDYEPTDWRGERHQRYIRYQNEAVRELCTRYGKVDVFWFDAVYWGGMFTAEMWDAENLTRMIRQLQPGILINNRTSVPGDFDTPEQRLGMFQSHRPWESCMSLCATWSYSDTATKSPRKLVELLVGTLAGDGNLLMSWGPQWSGAFAPQQIAALEGAGAWVKKNARALYGTRAGPWLPAKWGGSVHRDNLVYLHLPRPPADERLSLSGLQTPVLSARIHEGPTLAFRQTADALEIAIPAALHDPLATVVELTLAAPVAAPIPAPVRKSIFESPDYGGLISDSASLRLSSASKWDKSADHPRLFTGELTGDAFAFHTAEELNPRAIIALDRPRSVRGVLVQNRDGHPSRRTGLVVSLSLDGVAWEQIWAASDREDVWEIPVTRFVAGAHLPGREARCVKIERRLEKPDALHLQTVKIYGE